MAHSVLVPMTIRCRKNREKNNKGKWLFPQRTTFNGEYILVMFYAESVCYRHVISCHHIYSRCSYCCFYTHSFLFFLFDSVAVYFLFTFIPVK
jgi:hypothetical protein